MDAPVRVGAHLVPDVLHAIALNDRVGHRRAGRVEEARAQARGRLLEHDVVDDGLTDLGRPYQDVAQCAVLPRLHHDVQVLTEGDERKLRRTLPETREHRARATRCDVGRAEAHGDRLERRQARRLPHGHDHLSGRRQLQLDGGAQVVGRLALAQRDLHRMVRDQDGAHRQLAISDRLAQLTDVAYSRGALGIGALGQHVLGRALDDTNGHRRVGHGCALRVAHTHEQRRVGLDAQRPGARLARG